jgi:hypothetical protein
VQEAVQEWIRMQQRNYYFFPPKESWHWGNTGGHALQAAASMLKNDKSCKKKIYKLFI